MKHVLYSWLLMLMLTTGVAFAQDGRQRIESARIAYITNRLNLTTEQAPQFWAVYNEYNGRKQELNRRLRQLSGDPTRPGLTESNALADLKEINATKQKIADLDDEYMSRFLKVISPQQLRELYSSEREFNKMLLNRLGSPRQ